ncbi:MAG: DUF87 domain-containing protein [Candidatus Aenigmarchaeota archaeon]|nr:DUF87 domain-containing protein [Candidatus Aenigmarchaeota archaeon]
MVTEMHERLVSDEIKRLIPVLGKASATRLGRAYLLADEDTRKRIFELIDVLKAATFSDEDLRDSVLMEPPNKEIAMSGDIEIGEVLYGKKRLYPLKIGKNALLTHIGIFGSTGYGKTNIAYDLIDKINENDVPILIFDFSKRNYRDLLQTKLKDHINVYTIGRDPAPFKFNPLKPPEGIQISQWMKEFSSIFDHAYMLMGGGRHLIMKSLDAIHEEKQHPILSDIKRWLEGYGGESLSSRERNWLSTSLRPLASLCFREIAEIWKCKEGIQPSEFFQKGKITILELDALDANDRAFFIEIILQWIRDWLLIHGKKEELQGVIILEEAHHVLNREKSSSLGIETVMDLIFREIRELGMGIIYIDQHPSLVSYPALGNTSTHIYMNLGLDTKHASDVLDASNMLGLNYEEQGIYLRKLPIGHGFMLMRMSAFHDPFLVQFKKYSLRKGAIKDEDVRKHMRAQVPEIFARLKEPSSEKEPADEIPIEELEEQGWNILHVLGEGRAAFTSQIYKAVKISGSTFNKHVRGLIDSGLVKIKQAKVGKNKLNYYYLTELGQGIFEKQFGRIEGEKEINIDDVYPIFSESGWTYNEEKNCFTFEEGGKKISVMVETGFDRDKIAKDVSENKYFLCASASIKNIIIQEVAKFSYESGRKPTIFISTVKEFEKKGKFERIEFV